MPNYTDSPLVSVKKLIKKNYSSREGSAIDQVSIHSMAGNASVEGCGDWFNNPKCGGSSNYGIGSDGRIGLYIREQYRSWCTSSKAVDKRAVTIEVANIENKEPWRISQKAENSLIDLLADICKRNGIKKLLWKNDKSLVNKVDKQNMVPHCFVYPKECPGKYMLSRYGYYADTVNEILGAKYTNTASASTLNIQATVDPESKIWNWLVDRGLNYTATAGVMGNIYAESALQANNLQNTYEKILGLTDTEYTESVDNGTYPNFINDKAGYGLCQWTYPTRKEALLALARERKLSIGDISLQLAYLWREMEAIPNFLYDLNHVSSIFEATKLFMLKFERPADQSDEAINRRNKYSEEIYNKHAPKNEVKAEDMGSNDKVPFLIHTNTAVLNIRKGPDKNSDRTGQIDDMNLKFTIVEVAGSGDQKWYKLKSGAGWVFAKYCDIIK